MSTTFKCAICGETFEKILSEEEEAIQQLNEEFPGFEPAECDLVCHDCYMQHFEPASH